MSSAPKFKEMYTFEQRRAKFEYLKSKEPSRIPLICEELQNSNRFPELETRRITVPAEITVAQLIYLLRRRMGLSPEEALFVFAGSSLLSSNTLISVAYERYKDPDGFLYIKYSGENTFASLVPLTFMDSGIAIAAVVAISLKLLLLPSKHSTDFEVHRNWLAITHNLPLKDWYQESGSVWTLDYPPMFAYFEFVLAKIANLIFPAADFLRLESHNNADKNCLYFQKATVIASDLLLLFAICRKWSYASASQRVGLLLLCLMPALLMIDHIHFQYNGMLVGLFLLSIKAIVDGQLIVGSALFTLLVCFKHLFLVFAPVLGLYVLMSIFKKPTSAWLFEFALTAYSCSKMLLISFLPFVLKQQLPQIVSRLFPTGRGLMHAYWAPNFWALYAASDIVATRVFKISPDWYAKLFGNREIPVSTLTNGVVAEKSFAILPNILPFTCLSIITLVHIPLALKLCRNPSPKMLINCLVVSGLISFLFGYHVHEKGLIPVLAIYLYFNESFSIEAHSKMLSIMLSSQLSLLPLMHGWIEGAIALIMIFAGGLVHAGLAEVSSGKIYGKVLFALIPLFVALYAKFFLRHLEFAPLLAISTFYALVLLIQSLRLYKSLFFIKKI